MKPVVTFKQVRGPVEVGRSAYIGGLSGHPRQGSTLAGECVQTSTIQRVASEIKLLDGVQVEHITEFETLNTIYRPEAA